MNHVEHIPQTLASHSGSHLWEAQQDEHGADMLKADPRDTFFLSKFQWNGSVPIPDGIWGEEKGHLRRPCHPLPLSWVEASLLGSVGARWDALGFPTAPAIEASRVENVLVPCAYSPTYVVKDFPIARYQGLQFVSVSLGTATRRSPGWGCSRPGKIQEEASLAGGSGSSGSGLNPRGVLGGCRGSLWCWWWPRVPRCSG